MDREDKILNMIHDSVLWVFLGFMVAVLCISAAREKKNSAYIVELEQQVQAMDSKIKEDHKTISNLQTENEMLEQSLEETLKMYNDAIDAAHDEEVKSMSEESLYRSYKLEEGKEDD